MPRVPHSTDDLAEVEQELRRALEHGDVFSLEALADAEAELLVGLLGWRPPGVDDRSWGAAAERRAFGSGLLHVEEIEVERQRVRVLGELATTDVVARLTGAYAGEPFDERRRVIRSWRLADSWTVLDTHARPAPTDRRPA